MADPACYEPLTLPVTPIDVDEWANVSFESIRDFLVVSDEDTSSRRGNAASTGQGSAAVQPDQPLSQPGPVRTSTPVRTLPVTRDTKSTTRDPRLATTRKRARATATTATSAPAPGQQGMQPMTSVLTLLADAAASDSDAAPSLTAAQLQAELDTFERISRQVAGQSSTANDPALSSRRNATLGPASSADHSKIRRQSAAGAVQTGLPALIGLEDTYWRMIIVAVVCLVLLCARRALRPSV